jgi:Tol biopolymer transport system component/DNA-binding winged helix-turn-helix (wHTH) protein
VLDFFEMPPPRTSGEIYRFGAFELASGTGELRKNGLRLKLQDQPLRILILLVENAGEVVTREQIQKRLWADDTHVDYENAINSAVRKMRDTLSDTSANPRFVETLARRGYRFIAAVSRAPHADAPISSPQTTPVPEPARTESLTRPRKIRAFTAVALMLVATLGGWTAFRWLRGANSSALERAQDSRPAPPIPLTSYPGVECCPSFSPEGSRVAFSWNGPKQDNFDIYVKQIGPGEPQRLTRDSAKDTFPVWSPDGKWIAFIRARNAQNVSVVLMPSVGGPEREVARINLPLAQIDYFLAGPALAWSVDGNYLFTLEQPGEVSSFGIVRIAVGSGEKRPLTRPPFIGDGILSVSPDGRTLAFVRIQTQKVVSDIYTVPLAEWTELPQPRRVTFDGKGIFGLGWSENGSELIFRSNRSGSVELWKERAVGSEQPVRVEVAGWNNDLYLPVQQYFAISSAARRMVFSQPVLGGPKVWRLETVRGSGSKPVMLISSTRGEMSPQFSPDGKRIALRSNQSGRGEIWVYNRDGTSPVQFTSWNFGFSGSPAWSPDGTRIAFDSSNSGRWEIYTVNSQGGTPTQLTKGVAATVPAWSRDGKWVYFSRAREIWKIQATGGTEVQVTKNGGVVAQESVDGKKLFYTKTTTGGDLWQMPVGGGQEALAGASIQHRNFAVASTGIYFVQDTKGVSDLRFLPFAPGPIRTIASLGRPVDSGIAVSPDERFVLFTQADFDGSDLMLVENFR